MSQYVKIHYGPYEAFHTTSHKPAKLKGVRDKLRKLGFRVDLNPVEHVNYCVFEIMGYQFQKKIKVWETLFGEKTGSPFARKGLQLQAFEKWAPAVFQVFRCNIRNLQLNMESDSDPVATRAVQACLAASDQLERARCHFWIRRVIDAATFNRTSYQDQWPFDIQLKPYAGCVDCAKCCGILTRKKTVEKEVVNYNEIKQNLLYDLSIEKTKIIK